MLLSSPSRRVAVALGVAPCSTVSETTAHQQSGDICALGSGERVEREIEGGEMQLFAVSLEAGQYTRLVLRRRGIDLLVAISTPDRRTVTRHENPAGPQSPVTVSIMAVTTGAYIVEVRPLEKWAAAGRYEIELESVRSPGPLDEKRLTAERKVEEGRRQQLLETKESSLAALASYEEALTFWREMSDRFEEANTLQFIAETHDGLRDSKAAIDKYEIAINARRDDADRQAEAYTRLWLAKLYPVENPDGSLPHHEAALKLFKEGHNRRGQAAAFYEMGLTKAHKQDWRTAIDYYEQALNIYSDQQDREAFDRHEEARALQAIGGAYGDWGNHVEALKFYHRALEGWQATGDLAQEGNTYNSLAVIEETQGNLQTALDNYAKALDRYQRGEVASERGKAAIRRMRASTLFNVGDTYATLLGDYPKAFELLQQSLSLRDDSRGKGRTLMMIGYVHVLAGEPQEALESCRQALPLQEEAGDLRKSQTFTVMGMAYSALGDHPKALEFYTRALEIQQNPTRPDRGGEAITQYRLGESYAAIREYRKALDAYARARRFWREEGRDGEALALFGMARVEKNLNNLGEALKHVRDALNVIEPLRTNVTGPQLRASYYATKIDYYELYIDLCMRLRDTGNHAALTAEAFAASERSRARSLLDMLAQARVEAGLKSDPSLAALIDKRRNLQKALDSTKIDRARTPKEKEATEGVAIGLEISRLSTERDSVEARLRSQYPRFAALMYPEPLTAVEAQSLLDDETLLLEFALGEDRSYVWALTSTELLGYPLPSRSDVEITARRLVELLRTGQPIQGETAARRKARMAQAESEYWRLATGFSRTILAPVAALLKKKRILVVADGQLRYLPFAALPSPRSALLSGPTLGATPLDTLLVKDHEIVSLPSASLLSVLRQTAPREPAPKSVAIFADPVFEKDDPRIQHATSGNIAPVAERRGALVQALRDVDGAGEASNLPRLPATGQEALDIEKVAPLGSSMKAIGFKANRKNATSAELSQYRIVHFATHGLLNEKNPELSGIVLSLYDEEGRFHEEGFLRLGDIYSLKLPVDLVVLSACRSGLGKEVRGEGLIGLTRGFMYAGASRVIASLWKVDDEATAELMKRFYEKMLRDGMSPAAALRAAQVSLSEQRRWSSPYYWSGFVLQGEWK